MLKIEDTGIEVFHVSVKIGKLHIDFKCLIVVSILVIGILIIVGILY